MSGKKLFWRLVPMCCTITVVQDQGHMYTYVHTAHPYSKWYAITDKMTSSGQEYPKISAEMHEWHPLLEGSFLLKWNHFPTSFWERSPLLFWNPKFESSLFAQGPQGLAKSQSSFHISLKKLHGNEPHVIRMLVAYLAIPGFLNVFMMI
jgi:hypothetical protein